MGIWTDTFIAPATPALLPAEEFERLVVDLGRERLVRMPWAVFAGKLCVNAGLGWGSVLGRARFEPPAIGTELVSEDGVPDDGPGGEPPPWGVSVERAVLLARGQTLAEVVPALRTAPYGQQDIAVAFDCLDFSNPAVLDHYWYEDERTVLACFALAKPQHRPLEANTGGRSGGPTHPVQTCVVNTFKAGEGTPCPAIKAVAARHFGPALVTGETWG
ncbi:hypothetical protein ACFWY6_14635 [Streptomyces sp. NPDC059037]|uniref:hypothetical protein n=1 Tax=Streptomyces sp. NPDC059037 TaxID=3346710 RepID=UPI003684B229